MHSFCVYGRRCTNIFCLAWRVHIIFAFSHVVAQDSPYPAPIAVPPSTDWVGNDGPWSSFSVQVGSPAQMVLVLPSSSGSSLWPVVAEGCTDRDPSECPESRGGLFNPNVSSTWVEQGLYELPLEPEMHLGYSGNGIHGFDSLVLSYKGGGGAIVNNSVVAGIATKDFYIGILGLTPYGTNFTDVDEPKPSILNILHNSRKILSRSWAYTAGAFSTPKKTLGSLVLGGYEASRFTPNNLTIGLGPDISRDLLVGIQSIKIGEINLLNQSIVAYIDSTIPHIWLPIAACQNFERVFSLTWSPELELYLINDTLHSTLLIDNPTITFAIASSAGGGDVVDIQIPYSAFNLEAREPLTSNGTSRYFPLRRAQNETQYTLGRAFLQYAYLIVDYDRHNFSVSQAIFPDTGVDENLVAIVSPSHDDGRLASRTIAGIATGATMAALIGIAAALLYLRKRRSHRQRQSKEETDSQQEPFSKPELHASQVLAELPLLSTQSSSEADKAELTRSRRWAIEISSCARAEAGNSEISPKEMPGSEAVIGELDGFQDQRTWHEMP